MNKYQNAHVRIDHCQSRRVIAAITRFAVFFSEHFQSIGRTSPSRRKARVCQRISKLRRDDTTIIIIAYVYKTAHNNIISYPHTHAHTRTHIYIYERISYIL